MNIRANILPLCWENQFFGIKSAILCISDTAPILTERRLRSWPLVQAKIPMWEREYLDELQHLKFKVVEGEVDFAISVKPCEVTDVEVAGRIDIPELRIMASKVFSKSRFRAPWYSKCASSQFYAKWIENAVTGYFDDICLVFRDRKGSINGFVSIRRLNKTEARIGLLAGYGMGRKLIRSALYWSFQKKIATLHVATQTSNFFAVKRYISSGAVVTSMTYWLYK